MPSCFFSSHRKLPQKPVQRETPIDDESLFSLTIVRSTHTHTHTHTHTLFLSLILSLSLSLDPKTITFSSTFPSFVHLSDFLGLFYYLQRGLRVARQRDDTDFDISKALCGEEGKAEHSLSLSLKRARMNRNSKFFMSVFFLCYLFTRRRRRRRAIFN